MPQIMFDSVKGLRQRTGAGICMAPQIFGESQNDTGQATSITATAGIEIVDYTAAAAVTITLPAAKLGEVYIYVQACDVAHSTLAALTFDCDGTDVIETGSLAETRSGAEVLFDTSTAGETKLAYTPTNSVNNMFSIGSRIVWTCVNAGKWMVDVQPRAYPNGAGTTGTMLFAT